MSRSTHFFRLLAVLTATAVSGFSQRTPPSLQPPPPAPTPSTEAPIQTLRANAQLVVVDVIVTDSKQTPIHNLQASDFSVLENGAPQQITGFEGPVNMLPPKSMADGRISVMLSPGTTYRLRIA